MLWTRVMLQIACSAMMNPFSVTYFSELERWN